MLLFIPVYYQIVAVSDFFTVKIMFSSIVRFNFRVCVTFSGLILTHFKPNSFVLQT